MRKNVAQALLLISLVVMAAALNACSGFSGNTGGTAPHPGEVLVTQQDAVTLLNTRTGGQIWQYRTQMDHFMPLFSGNMVYIVSETINLSTPTKGTLQALDLASGHPLWNWSWKEDETLPNAPTIADGIIYLSESTIRTLPEYHISPGDYQGFVVALRASDGKQLWKISLPGQFSPPTVANGTVYVNSGFAVLALRASDGKQLWQYQPEAGENFDYYTSMGSQEREANVLVVQGGKLYVYLQHLEGNGWVLDLAALDSTTGRMDWLYPSHGILEPPFLLRDNTIYLSTSYVSQGNPFVAALNASSGSVLWTYQEASATLQSQLVLAGNLLYGVEASSSATSDIVALSTTDGRVQHRYPSPGKEVFIGSPVVDQQVLFLNVVLPGTPQWQQPLGVVALDTTSGAEIWHSAPLQPFQGISMLVSQGQVYTFSAWGYTPDTLVVFQESNGKQLWKYPTTG